MCRVNVLSYKQMKEDVDNKGKQLIGASNARIPTEDLYRFLVMHRRVISLEGSFGNEQGFFISCGAFLTKILTETTYQDQNSHPGSGDFTQENLTMDFPPPPGNLDNRLLSLSKFYQEIKYGLYPVLQARYSCQNPRFSYKDAKLELTEQRKKEDYHRRSNTYGTYSKPLRTENAIER
ncbi:hypothetical protein HAX54_032545 [Datura stramonium]|uniref:Uncharacterized protein n=1 Tax=Datura stramonium TaxID=4076 RepID=A0ABS8VBE9_DATST|nr:hypothetical protein [Datura stramonium]